MVIDILETLGETPAAFDIAATLSDGPEAVAGRLRTRLGSSLDRQTRRGQTDKAFKAWREAIESAGVLVFVLSGAHHQVDLAEMCGFAIAVRSMPAPQREIETFRNHLAAAVLMPRGAMLAGPIVIARRAQNFPKFWAGYC